MLGRYCVGVLAARSKAKEVGRESCAENGSPWQAILATMAVIQDEALVTAIAHACKYPYTTVVGLLLGTSDGKAISVTKAVPLVHHHHQLTLATEAALMQVACYSCALSSLVTS